MAGTRRTDNPIHQVSYRNVACELDTTAGIICAVFGTCTAPRFSGEAGGHGNAQRRQNPAKVVVTPRPPQSVVDGRRLHGEVVVGRLGRDLGEHRGFEDRLESRRFGAGAWQTRDRGLSGRRHASRRRRETAAAPRAKEPGGRIVSEPRQREVRRRRRRVGSQVRKVGVHDPHCRRAAWAAGPTRAIAVRVTTAVLFRFARSFTTAKEAMCLAATLSMCCAESALGRECR